MNKKTKIGLSILTFAFGASIMLSGCAPKVTKTSSSALPPAQKPAPAAVTTSPTPATTTAPQAAAPSEYPWLANYDISSNLNNIHFAFDKSMLTGVDKVILKKDAIYLENNPGVTVQIQGNCDRRGSEAYNLALGWRRANAAKMFLEDMGISSSRLKTISYGKEKPLCKEHTESCYAMNRNDHFAIVSK